MIENKDKSKIAKIEIEHQKEEKMWSAYSLAMNLGFMIVIPIVIFGAGGVVLDKKFDCFPIFTLIGFVLAMTASLLTVYIKTKDIILTGKKKK